jgi:hypothetical protein
MKVLSVVTKIFLRMKVLLVLMYLSAFSAFTQTPSDTLMIRQAALDYIESQHRPNAEQMSRSIHPRLVKRTFWRSKSTGREFISETSAEEMVITAEGYNKNGNRFPAIPKKEVKIFDIEERTASVKLIADEWIDYMHLIKIDGKWKVINVLWQYHDVTKHQ